MSIALIGDKQNKLQRQSDSQVKPCLGFQKSFEDMLPFEIVVSLHTSVVGTKTLNGLVSIFRRQEPGFGDTIVESPEYKRPTDNRKL